MDAPEVADLVAVLRVLFDATANAGMVRLLTGPNEYLLERLRGVWVEGTTEVGAAKIDVALVLSGFDGGCAAESDRLHLALLQPLEQ